MWISHATQCIGTLVIGEDENNIGLLRLTDRQQRLHRHDRGDCHFDNAAVPGEFSILSHR